MRAATNPPSAGAWRTRTTRTGRWTPMVLGLVLAISPAMVGGLAAQEGPEAAVEAVVQELFDHMRAGDADAMAELMHPEVRLVTTGMQGGTPGAQVVPVGAWLDGVRNSTAVLDEELYDVEVRVNQGLATVWTGYELRVDGEFSHCGVDAFQLVRTGDGWRILQVADTRTTEGCPGR